MKSGIYTITSPSGGQYVGSAVDVGARLSRHKGNLKNEKYPNHPLQHAANKYGIENLVFSRLIICRIEDLLMFEQKAIDILKPQYNISPKAGSQLGYRHTAEARIRMGGGNHPMKRLEVRTKARATKLIPENREKASKTAKLARNRSEVVAKINAAWLKPEVRAKISGDNSSMKRLEVRAKISATMKAKGDDLPVKRQEVRVKLKNNHATKRPEILAKRIEKMSGLNNPMKRPEVRAKMIETSNRPEVRARKSESLKRSEIRININAALAKPEVRAKMRASRLAYLATKRLEEFRFHASMYGL